MIMARKRKVACSSGPWAGPATARKLPGLAAGPGTLRAWASMRGMAPSPKARRPRLRVWLTRPSTWMNSWSWESPLPGSVSWLSRICSDRATSAGILTPWAKSAQLPSAAWRPGDEDGGRVVRVDDRLLGRGVHGIGDQQLGPVAHLVDARQLPQVADRVAAGVVHRDPEAQVPPVEVGGGGRLGVGLIGRLEGADLQGVGDRQTQAGLDDEVPLPTESSLARMPVGPLPGLPSEAAQSDHPLPSWLGLRPASRLARVSPDGRCRCRPPAPAGRRYRATQHRRGCWLGGLVEADHGRHAADGGARGIGRRVAAGQQGVVLGRVGQGAFGQGHLEPLRDGRQAPVLQGQVLGTEGPEDVGVEVQLVVGRGRLHEVGAHAGVGRGRLGGHPVGPGQGREVRIVQTGRGSGRCRDGRGTGPAAAATPGPAGRGTGSWGPRWRRPGAGWR